MTTEQLIELFKQADEVMDIEVPAEFRVASRNDINAFILLDKLLPHTPSVHGNHTYYGDMVSCAEHDEIWLDVELEELAKVITETQVRVLSALGVHLDSHNESLHMFV